MNDNSRDAWILISLFVCMGAVFVTWIYMAHTNHISREELYRFCMVKSIPLRECITPPKHMHKKKESNNDQ